MLRDTIIASTNPVDLSATTKATMGDTAPLLPAKNRQVEMYAVQFPASTNSHIHARITVPPPNTVMDDGRETTDANARSFLPPVTMTSTASPSFGRVTILFLWMYSMTLFPSDGHCSHVFIGCGRCRSCS
jgi:hypothetical protein